MIVLQSKLKNLTCAAGQVITRLCNSSASFLNGGSSSSRDGGSSSSSRCRGDVVVVAGAKGSGKSTLCRCLVNQMLDFVPEVAFLDLDPGQPEFTPPGVLSICILDQQSVLLGMPHSHMRQPDVSHFLVSRMGVSVVEWRAVRGCTRCRQSQASSQISSKLPCLSYISLSSTREIPTFTPVFNISDLLMPWKLLSFILSHWMLPKSLAGEVF